MFDLDTPLQHALDDAGRAWLTEAKVDLSERGVERLPVRFAQLARKTGKLPLLDTGPGSPATHGAAQVDLGMWRTCDAAGYALIHHVAADDAALVDLFLHGDFEERIAALEKLEGDWQRA